MARALLPTTVTVRATDPYGDPNADSADPLNSVEVTVTITVNDVNEAPIVSGGLTNTSLAENFDSDGDTENDVRVLNIDVYMATDVESTETDNACDEIADQGSVCTWSLEGDDASLFEISNEAAAANGQLSFKNAPDFENPADADMDNVYEVTVKVTDNGVDNKNKMSATRDVMITVTNADEPGEVTFSSVQPKVGRPFTATLNDPDGMTTGVKWEWMRTSTGIGDTPASCSDNPEFDAPIDEDSDSYTPKEADLYQCLEASATYTDPVGSGVVAMDASANAVVANTDNVAPEFKEGGEKPVMQATRKIAENSVSTGEDPNLGNVGTPVAATDPNGGPDDPEGRLTHTLGGPDKDSFEIEASSGQITVGADTELDYESNKKTYMVTVTATDPLASDDHHRRHHRRQRRQRTPELHRAQ